MALGRAHDLGLDVLTGLGMMDEVIHGHIGPGAAILVDRRVARDAEEEGHERKSAVLISIERLHRAQEHVGHQVLRLVLRAGPRQAVAVDRFAITLVELTERRGISGLGGFHKRRVDTASLRGSGRLAGDAGVRNDLRAPRHHGENDASCFSVHPHVSEAHFRAKTGTTRR